VLAATSYEYKVSIIIRDTFVCAVQRSQGEGKRSLSVCGSWFCKKKLHPKSVARAKKRGHLTLGIDFIVTVSNQHKYTNPPKKRTPGTTR
jgi:hypothetical protein